MRHRLLFEAPEFNIDEYKWMSFDAKEKRQYVRNLLGISSKDTTDKSMLLGGPKKYSELKAEDDKKSEDKNEYGPNEKLVDLGVKIINETDAKKASELFSILKRLISKDLGKVQQYCQNISVVFNALIRTEDLNNTQLYAIQNSFLYNINFYAGRDVDVENRLRILTAVYMGYSKGMRIPTELFTADNKSAGTTQEFLPTGTANEYRDKLISPSLFEKEYAQAKKQWMQKHNKDSNGNDLNYPQKGDEELVSMTYALVSPKNIDLTTLISIFKKMGADTMYKVYNLWNNTFERGLAGGGSASSSTSKSVSDKNTDNKNPQITAKTPRKQKVKAFSETALDSLRKITSNKNERQQLMKDVLELLGKMDGWN